MAQEWRDSFSVFLAHVGRRPSPAHSLGRKDNDLGYSPGNVEWETLDQQANNKRTSRFVQVGAHRRTVGQWSKLLGISGTRLYSLTDEQISARVQVVL